MLATAAHLTAITDLLAQGADPNARDANGYAPLHLAYENYDLVRQLLEFGADVNLPDPTGETVLAKVAKLLMPGQSNGEAEYFEQIAMLLIEHGADVDIVSAVLIGDITLLNRPKVQPA